MFVTFGAVTLATPQTREMGVKYGLERASFDLSDSMVVTIMQHFARDYISFARPSLSHICADRKQWARSRALPGPERSSSFAQS